MPTSQALVTISVTAALTAVDDTATTPVNTAVGIAVLANDELNGGPITAADLSSPPTILTPPSNGVAVWDADTETFIYTPNEGYCGPDAFVYAIVKDCGAPCSKVMVINGTVLAGIDPSPAGFVWGETAYIELRDPDGLLAARWDWDAGEAQYVYNAEPYPSSVPCNEDPGVMWLIDGWTLWGAAGESTERLACAYVGSECVPEPPEECVEVVTDNTTATFTGPFPNLPDGFVWGETENFVLNNEAGPSQYSYQWNEDNGRYELLISSGPFVGCDDVQEGWTFMYGEGFSVCATVSDSCS